jgi:hypothetical protein
MGRLCQAPIRWPGDRSQVPGDFWPRFSFRLVGEGKPGASLTPVYWAKVTKTHSLPLLVWQMRYY